MKWIRSSIALVTTLAAAACAPSIPSGTGGTVAATAELPDTAGARHVFEVNIDAIHKRDRNAYLATYIHSPLLARNGPGGLQMGYEGWSATRDSTWPDTLIARNLKVVPVARDVVYGSYCYTVTQHDTTTSGVSERIFVKTPDGWRIAVTTAFGLPVGAPAQCK